MGGAPRRSIGSFSAKPAKPDGKRLGEQERIWEKRKSCHPTRSFSKIPRGLPPHPVRANSSLERRRCHHANQQTGAQSVARRGSERSWRQGPWGWRWRISVGFKELILKRQTRGISVLFKRRSRRFFRFFWGEFLPRRKGGHGDRVGCGNKSSRGGGLEVKAGEFESRALTRLRSPKVGADCRDTRSCRRECAVGKGCTRSHEATKEQKEKRANLRPEGDMRGSERVNARKHESTKARKHESTKGKKWGNRKAGNSAREWGRIQNPVRLGFYSRVSLHSLARAASPLFWVVSAKQPYHFFRWVRTPYPLKAPEVQRPPVCFFSSVASCEF
jgi:hypothetical protein